MKNAYLFKILRTIFCFLPLFLPHVSFGITEKELAKAVQNAEKNIKQKKFEDWFPYDKLFEENLIENNICYNARNFWGNRTNKWYIDNIRKQLAAIKKALPQIAVKAYAKEAESIAEELAALPNISDDTLHKAYGKLQDRVLVLILKLKKIKITGIEYQATGLHCLTSNWSE